MVSSWLQTLTLRYDLRFSIQRAPQTAFGQGSNNNPDGVASEIGPQEAETKDQSAQRCVANAVDPGSVVQLADLNEERENQRDRRSRNHSSASEQSTHQQEQHQRPQRVTGVLTNELRQDRLITTRRKANDRDRNCAKKERDAGPDQFWLTPEFWRSKELRHELQNPGSRRIAARLLGFF
jgi:hypothetical protein